MAFRRFQKRDNYYKKDLGDLGNKKLITRVSVTKRLKTSKKPET